MNLRCEKKKITEKQRKFIRKGWYPFYTVDRKVYRAQTKMNFQKTLPNTNKLSLDSKSISASASESSELRLLGKCDNEKKYRVRQKYLTILQNSSEWNRWRGEFVLERPSSETQSISVAMERWSVEHRAFAVETYFKNIDSVLTQRIFRRHFNIHRNECP